MGVLGGNSGERAVSIDTGKACAKALKKRKYKVTFFDPKFKNFNFNLSTNVHEHYILVRSCII